MSESAFACGQDFLTLALIKRYRTAPGLFQRKRSRKATGIASEVVGNGIMKTLLCDLNHIISATKRIALRPGTS